PVPATELPVTAADVRNNRARLFLVDHGVAHQRAVRVVGEREGRLYLEPDLAPGSLVVLDGRSLLADGDRVQSTEVPQATPPAAPQPTPQPAHVTPATAAPPGAAR